MKTKRLYFGLNDTEMYVNAMLMLRKTYVILRDNW